MKLNCKMRTVLWRLVQAGIIFLTVIGYVKGLFISLDIDESYAVAQSYRLAIGEHLFVDMWESHQLSAYLSAVFIKIYLCVFQTTDYLVIYLRTIGMLIHVGFGLWLQRSLKKDFNAGITFLLVCLHLNFFPKWVQMPEFELMHYWALLAIFLILHSYFGSETRGWWKPFLAGICLVGSMMSYPTMLMLYPVYVIGLCILERGKASGKRGGIWRSSLWLTLGAGGSGVAFLLYLFSYQSLQELLQNVSYVFMDESHTTYTMAEKWSMYGEQAKGLWDVYMQSFLSAVVMVAIVGGILLIFGRFSKNLQGNLTVGKRAEAAFLSILILTAILLQKDHILGCLVEDQNQFFLQVRYIAAILPAVYMGIRYHKRMAVYFWLCVMPALVSLPAVLLITNMNVNVTCSRAVIGIWGSICMLCIYLREKLQERLMGKVLTYGLSFSILMGFFVCRLVMIRVTGCLPVTVMAPMEKMEYGPEKGIYILDEQAQIWNDNYAILDEIIDEEDRLLYIGAENLIYPAMGCGLSTPSTQGTTVFNEMFLQYYREHPQKVPTVVVIDKTFTTNPVYGLFSDAGVVLEWIEENYPNARVQETAYMTILYLSDT